MEHLSKLKKQPKKVLIFRIGQLGDTVVSLPALVSIRKTFPDAELHWMGDRHVGKSFVTSQALLDGLGLVSRFIYYPVISHSRDRLKWLFSLIGLWLQLLTSRYDIVIRLDPEDRSERAQRRDRLFFRFCGIKEQVCFNEYRIDGRYDLDAMNQRRRGSELQEHEVDFYQRALLARGFAEVDAALAMQRLNAASEEESVRIRSKYAVVDKEALLVGIGVGSKMPAKQWPIERYIEVLALLRKQYPVTPVFFGGPEDRETSDRVIQALGEGLNFCGELSLRGSVVALADCILYMGNDTGTMHLAVAAGLPCVAVFSARDTPGKWYPYGAQHQVHRAQVPCAGCMLTDCIEMDNLCLKRIEIAEVAESCRRVLDGMVTQGR